MSPRQPPGAVGARAEAAVAAALVRAGHTVFLPAFGTNGRIDLIYAADRRIVRVQCKTARLIGEIIQFRTCSNTANTPREYLGEVDELGVYSPDTGNVYLVPVDGLPTRACALRLAAARNGQAVGVRWASDYLLGPP